MIGWMYEVSVIGCGIFIGFMMLVALEHGIAWYQNRKDK